VYLRRLVPYRTQDNGVDGIVITLVDITERQQAADAVIRLATIVESSADAIFSKDLDGTVRTWNAGAERLYGYRAEDIVGQSVKVLVPEDGVAEWTEIMTHVRRGEPIEHLETERLCKDGRRVPVALTLSPIRDSNGRVVHASVVARDISEQKQAERVLRENEKCLADDLANMTRLQQVSTRLVQSGESSTLLLEILDAAIAATVADMGNIQLVDQHTRTLKIVASRGFEKPFLEYFNSVHEGQAACGTALQRGERLVIEDVTTSPVFIGTPALDVLLAAGVRAVQTTPLVQRNGQLVGMLSTHYRTPRRLADRDLSIIDLLARQAADWVERTHDEDTLREREVRLRRMMENAHVGIAFGDSKGRIVQANRTMMELVGWSEDDLRAGRLNCGSLCRPEDREQDLQAMDQLATAGRVGPAEKVLVRTDGTPIPVLISANRLDGSRDDNVTFVVDLTSQKQAEAALRNREERLRAVLETAADAIITIDHHGIIRSVNAATERMFGYSADEMIGQNVKMLHGVAEPGSARRPYRKILADGRKTHHRHQPGSRGPAQGRQPFPDGTGCQ
jgi:PAS domain S-box-containing protein